MSKIIYSNAIGSIMYIMAYTRPRLAFGASTLSNFVSYRGPSH